MPSMVVCVCIFGTSDWKKLKVVQLKLCHTVGCSHASIKAPHVGNVYVFIQKTKKGGS